MPPPKTPDPLFRVVSKLKNNRLVAAREARGLSMSQAARAMGLAATQLCALENFKLAARGRRGTWTPTALRVAAFYAALPEDIWPDAINLVRRTESVRLLDDADVLGLAAPPTPHELAEESEERALFRAALDELSPMHAKIVRLRIDDEQQFDEIGAHWDLSRERARQLYEQAIQLIAQRIVRKTKGT